MAGSPEVEARAYVFMGHGDETNESFIVPPGHTIVVLSHSGDSIGHNQTKYMKVFNPDNREYILDPLNNIDKIQEILGVVAIYKSGETCPTIHHHLLHGHQINGKSPLLVENDCPDNSTALWPSGKIEISNIKGCLADSVENLSEYLDVGICIGNDNLWTPEILNKLLKAFMLDEEMHTNIKTYMVGKKFSTSPSHKVLRLLRNFFESLLDISQENFCDNNPLTGGNTIVSYALNCRKIRNVNDYTVSNLTRLKYTRGRKAHTLINQKVNEYNKTINEENKESLFKSTLDLINTEIDLILDKYEYDKIVKIFNSGHALKYLSAFKKCEKYAEQFSLRDLGKKYVDNPICMKTSSYYNEYMYNDISLIYSYIHKLKIDDDDIYNKLFKPFFYVSVILKIKADILYRNADDILKYIHAMETYIIAIRYIQIAVDIIKSNYHIKDEYMNHISRILKIVIFILENKIKPHSHSIYYTYKRCIERIIEEYNIALPSTNIEKLIFNKVLNENTSTPINENTQKLRQRAAHNAKLERGVEALVPNQRVPRGNINAHTRRVRNVFSNPVDKQLSEALIQRRGTAASYIRKNKNKTNKRGPVWKNYENILKNTAWRSRNNSNNKRPFNKLNALKRSFPTIEENYINAMGIAPPPSAPPRYGAAANAEITDATTTI